MLRPRVNRVHLTRGEHRFIFRLERPDRTNKVWSALTVRRKRYRAGWGVTGASLELSIFDG